MTQIVSLIFYFLWAALAIYGAYIHDEGKLFAGAFCAGAAFVFAVIPDRKRRERIDALKGKENGPAKNFS